jgi:hypothetical protein
MRTVYRYENDLGIGPYRAGSWGAGGEHGKMWDSHAGLHHPAWSSEVDWIEGEDEYGTYRGSILEFEECPRRYLAACDSREALDAWFDGWQDKLEANGFKVVEYTVPDENVVDGGSGLQCAFLPVGE